ncbi:acyltransferase [Spongiactinospora sp. TRM90649]|uniref:acyltransferase family protein n=1 Tax=Spongiactinospora sp. TRM90649 TaxID=3031114 RepID=UPI0023F9E6A2|nr:acyltransferase [Spongiactinospora sp. TRM90649]MDF5753818.1 acyltransferase [Spongiactinospora sp. TRM90649]
MTGTVQGAGAVRVPSQRSGGSRAADKGAAASPPSLGRIAELDLLRFLAALAVVAFHYLVAFASIWGERPSKLFPATASMAGLGILGVELFFMISGFVILMTVWGRGIGGFARSRLVRLFPAYWVSVLAVVGVYGLTTATALNPRLSTGEYAVNLTMLQRAFGVTDANGVYWSLWVELRFYLLIAVLVLAGVTMARCLIFMGVWLAATVAATFAELGPIADLVVMPKYSPYFIAGMALFLIRRFGSAVHLWAFVAAGYALALPSALQRVAGRVKAAGFKGMPVEDWMVVAAITLMFGVMAAVALGALSRLTWGGLTVLGGLTYPLYLFHTPVAVVLVPGLRDALPPWVVAAAATAAAIALSYAVYTLVERPVQRLFRPASRRGRAARRHATT